MDQLLERFLRYVALDTKAVEQTDAYPSSPGQLALGKMLASELRDLKLEGVRVDENGLVWADIPATVESAPRIAWFAHMDTSPEFTGTNVKPVIHKNYENERTWAIPIDERKLIEHLVANAGIDPTLTAGVASIQDLREKLKAQEAPPEVVTSFLGEI